MSVSDATKIAAPAIKLKGSLFALTVLQILETDLGKIAQQLQQLTRAQQNFFQNIPIVLDLHLLDGQEQSFKLAKLFELVYQANIIPVGVRTSSEALRQQAIAAKIAILPDGKDQEATPSAVSPSPKTTQPSAEIHLKSSSKIVTQPVRSGQQVYAKGSDLIVLAPVSAGAELMADGHIHVYDTLRGRALAGMHGDTQARIFCRKLEAELVAIAGIYKVQEDLPASSSPIQIHLDEQQRMIFSGFDL